MHLIIECLLQRNNVRVSTPYYVVKVPQEIELGNARDGDNVVRMKRVMKGFVITLTIPETEDTLKCSQLNDMILKNRAHTDLVIVASDGSRHSCHKSFITGNILNYKVFNLK